MSGSAVRGGCLVRCERRGGGGWGIEGDKREEFGDISGRGFATK